MEDAAVARSAFDDWGKNSGGARQSSARFVFVVQTKEIQAERFE